MNTTAAITTMTTTSKIANVLASRPEFFSVESAAYATVIVLVAVLFEASRAVTVMTLLPD
jgi:hypothetical protein